MITRVCPNCGAVWYTANATTTITCFHCEAEIAPGGGG